ncbi:hypothetical protein Q3G72_007510 [Acer saccharum]|nr:hypothetical protein Q3G72_007510 [Acer saccharum]
MPAPAQEEVAVAEATPYHSNSNLPLPLHSTPLKSSQDTEEKKTLVTAGTPQLRLAPTWTELDRLAPIRTDFDYSRILQPTTKESRRKTTAE